MNLQSIGVKGLASFRKRTTIKFKPATVYIITGRNGSGKSSLIVEALSLAFFNKTYKDISIADIINDDKDLCSVKIKTDEYVISRNREKSKSELIINNKESSQQELESLLKIDKDMFFNSVVFGQNSVSFVFLKDAQKKEFITKFSVQYIDDYIDKLDTQQKMYSDKHIKIKDNIEELNKQIELLNIKELRREYVIWKKNNSKVNKCSKTLLSKLETKQNKLSNKISISLIAIKNYEDKVSKIENKVHMESKRISDIEHDLYKINLDKRIIEDKTREHKSHINNIENNKGNCPFCLSKNIDKKKVIKIIDYDISTLKKELLLKERVSEAMQSKVNRIQRTSLDKLYNEQTQDLKKLENTSAYKEDLSIRLNDVNFEMQAIKVKIKEAYKQKNPYKKLYFDAKNKLLNLTDTLVILENDCEVCAQYNKAIVFWISKFKEFKSAMFSKVLDTLKPLSNSYLQFISDGKFSLDIEASIKQTQKRMSDKFNIKILQKDKIISFDRLSGGEKKQVSLALNFALVQVMHLFLSGGKFNFIVFDEIFDNLDSYCKEKVIDLLDKLRKITGKTIIMITHDELFVNKDNFINIEIINNGKTSKIKEVI